MKYILTPILFFCFALLLSAGGPKELPRASIDEQLPSAAVDAFLRAVKAKNMDLHSMMVVRDGRVVCEKWFGGHAPDKNHVMWSVSKTWTATAVGFAVTEKKFSVDDKVISFFPDDLPAEISPNLAEMRVRDLLTMSVGHDKDPTGSIRGADRNAEGSWEKAFLAVPVVHKPGTKFVYNSLATYMLASIVRKTTGENVLDYLKPRLLEPLGIVGAVWDCNPSGTNVGGWGLHVKTEDMAKLGLLLLQRGKWNGKQILPEAWVEEATTRKILQDPNVEPEKSDSDWKQGYCYQIWRCRNDAFRADGKDGQFIVVLPKENAVVVLTANIGDMQAELNLVWEFLLPALKSLKIDASGDRSVVKAKRTKTEIKLDGKLDEEIWWQAETIQIRKVLQDGRDMPSLQTQVRTLWDDKYLYVSYVAPYEKLTMFEPLDYGKRIGLWDGDVVEVFVCTEPKNIRRYSEYEVAPTGETIDLMLDLPAKDFHWKSGFEAAVHLDTESKVWTWTTELRIPMAALGGVKPAPGVRWRINYFRHSIHEKVFLCWNPTLTGSAHTPEMFGVLLFEE